LLDRLNQLDGDVSPLLAPFLLVAILVVAADKKLMQGQPSSRSGWTVVAIITIPAEATRYREPDSRKFGASDALPPIQAA